MARVAFCFSPPSPPPWWWWSTSFFPSSLASSSSSSSPGCRVCRQGCAEGYCSQLAGGGCSGSRALWLVDVWIWWILSPFACWWLLLAVNVDAHSQCWMVNVTTAAAAAARGCLRVKDWRRQLAIRELLSSQGSCLVCAVHAHRLLWYRNDTHAFNHHQYHLASPVQSCSSTSA